MQYENHQAPGCGGCLVLLCLFLLFSGGMPALGKFLGMLVYSGLLGFLVLGGLFWLFTWNIRRRVSEYEASRTESHKYFVELLVKILVKIAQADGHFTRAELHTILDFFQNNLAFSQNQIYWVKQLVKEARDNQESLEALLAEFKGGFNYESRLILLELIYQIIYTQNQPDAQTLNLARTIARALEISSYDQRAIEAKYMYGRQQGSSASSASAPGLEERYYATLGLEPGVGFDEIKKAYRKLCMQYHPDKVAHLGEEFKRVAEEKMKEINAAYEYFEKKFK